MSNWLEDRDGKRTPGIPWQTLHHDYVAFEITDSSGRVVAIVEDSYRASERLRLEAVKGPVEKHGVTADGKRVLLATRRPVAEALTGRVTLSSIMKRSSRQVPGKSRVAQPSPRAIACRSWRARRRAA